MSVIYALIPVAILFVVLAVIIFFWAVKSNQFEDIEREGMRILLDDEEEQTQQLKQQQDKNKPKNDESEH